MFKQLHIGHELDQMREKNRTVEEELLSETKRILNNDLLTDKKILLNLGRYNSTIHVMEEEDVDRDAVYTVNEIKKVSINYRFKFLESRDYKPEIPYEAVLKIKRLNSEYGKELKGFRILAPAEEFRKSNSTKSAVLFVKTNHDNFYLVHSWGSPMPWSRRIKYWPLRNFESLGITIFCYTLLLAAVLPTWAITLDDKATYWCGYRGGVFFHLLIFNSGFSLLFLLSYFRNFSCNLWDRKNDFD